MTAIFETLNRVLGVYALVLFVVGFFFNLLMFYVCCRIKDNTTFVFLRFFAISNIFTLLWWNLYHFYYPFFSLDVGLTWLWGCKIGSYVQFSSLQISAWFLVLISVDGVLSVYFRHWKTIYFKASRAYWASGVLIAVILLLNVNILVLFGYEVDFNGTIVVFCFQVEGYPETDWMHTYGQIHLALYSLAPFAILATSNMMLILKIKSRAIKTSTAVVANAGGHTANAGSNRTLRTIRVVMAITILFVIFTMPVTVATFFFNILFSTEEGTFVATVFDEITFTYFACNFFVTMFTNLLFKKEIYKIMGRNVLQTPENTSRSKATRKSGHVTSPTH